MRVLLVAALFLTACATTPPTPQVAHWTPAPVGPYACEPTVLFGAGISLKEDQLLFCKYNSEEKSLLCTRSMRPSEDDL